MSRLLQEIPMGDFAVTLRELNNGNHQAKLTSASHGPLIEIEKLENGHLKIRELEFGSAKMTVEHLAILFTLLGIEDEMMDEIKRIKELTHEDEDDD